MDRVSLFEKAGLLPPVSALPTRERDILAQVCADTGCGILEVRQKLVGTGMPVTLEQAATAAKTIQETER